MYRSFFALLLALLFVGTSNAAILDSYSGLTQLEDDDVEGIVGQTSPILGDGSFLFAVAQFPFIGPIGDTDTFTTSTPMLTAISLIKVNGAPVLANGLGLDQASFVFTAPTAAEWLALTGLVVNTDNTMIVAYDDPASAPSLHIDATTIATAIATTTNGTPMYEFGLDGAGTFWEAQIRINEAFDPLNIFDVANANTGANLAFAAALNVVYDYGNGPELLLHNYLGQGLVSELPNPFLPSDFTTATHLQIYGTKGGSAIQTTPPSTELPLPTDSTAYINVQAAVPEPASMLVWSGLSIVGFGLAAARKRRMAAKTA